VALTNLLKTSLILLLLLSALSILAIMPSSATSPPSSGQQLWYKLDEGIGLVAVDSSGNGHTGTIGSAVSWVAGKVNYAVQFDASANSYVDAGVLSAGVSDWAVALWLNSSNTGGDWHDVYAQSTWGQPGHWEIAVDTTSSHCGLVGAIALIASNLSPSLICSTFSVNDGAYHHIVVSYNHTYVNFYENKVLKDQIPVTGDIGVTTLPTCIGDRENGGSCVGGDYPWNGVVDEVMVYGRGLGQADVGAIYDYAAPVSTTTVTVTTTSPTTATVTVTGSTTQTVTSPTTVTHTSTSTVTSPVTSTSTRTTTVSSTVTSTTTRPTTATVTTTSRITTTVVPTSTTYTTTLNSTRTLTVTRTVNSTRTFNVTATTTATSTTGTTTTTSTAEAGMGGFGFAFVALALGLGAAGAGIGIAVAYKPTPPTPPMIPLTSLGQTPIGAPSYTQPQPPPTRGGFENPADRLRRERGY